MITKSFIQELLANKIAEKGHWYLVDLNVSPNNQIKVVLDSNSGFSIDDCIEVTRYFEKHIDREIEDFELEVSSAGLSEPFKVGQQYIKNLGKQVEVLAKTGQKTKGLLKSFENNNMVVEVESLVKVAGRKKKQKVIKEHLFNVDDLKSVKLVIEFK